MRAPLWLVFLIACLPASGQRIITIAGAPVSHRAQLDGVAAVNAPLANVYGLLLDRATGRLIVNDLVTVERIEPDGTLLVLAGWGSFGPERSDADGTPASILQLRILRGMAQDASGALYLADALTGAIFRISSDGTASRIFRPAASGSPRGMVFDSRGNLDFAEAYCRCIRRLDPAGVLSTVYALPPSGEFTYFEGLAIDGRDNLFATEFAGHQVMRIAADGSAAVVAGTGSPGFSGDGGPATAAQLQGPSGVAVLPDGTLYIADTGNHRVRRISPGGVITTIAGTGERGFAGDGGPAVNARLAQPAQVLTDGSGGLYVADYGTGHVRRIAPDGTISTVAGNGDVASDGVPYPPVAEGGPALHAFVGVVPAVALDGAGDLYVADMQESKVRKIAPDGTITTVAGTGVRGTTGDGGPAAKAGLAEPWGLATDTRGAVYIAQSDSRIRKIDANGIITTFAGTGTGTGLNRAQGDGGPASRATLNEAKGIAVDAAGNVYIADTSNARVRKVDTSGVIQTVAGPGEQGVDYWNAVAISPTGDVLVATTHAAPNNTFSRVQRINPDGSLTPVAGNGTACVGVPTAEFAYDGVPAAQAPLCVVVGLTDDARGTLYISDASYGAVLAMAPDGTIRRAVGSVLAATLGDTGPALSASLSGTGYFSPPQIAVNPAGDIFIGQAGAYRVRQVTTKVPALTVSHDAVDVSGGQSQKVSVGITLGAPVAYLVQIPAEAGWLTVNRAAGITGEAVTLTGNADGLAPGSYKTAVTVTVPSGATLQATVAVTMTVR